MSVFSQTGRENHQFVINARIPLINASQNITVNAKKGHRLSPKLSPVSDLHRTNI